MPFAVRPQVSLLRKFETGATRDTDEGKPHFAAFTSAAVQLRFAQYMDKHRIQADGNLRDPDNWKKGIPIEAYFDSADRHFMDWKLHEEGTPELARDQDLEEVLCALYFNIQGALHELLKVKRDASKTPA